MKLPWILRWELIVAVLRGRVVNIALQAGTPIGTIVRFGVVEGDVKHWRKRGARLRAARMSVKPPTVGPQGGAGDSGAHFDYMKEEPND